MNTNLHLQNKETLIELAVEATIKGHEALHMKRNEAFYDKLAVNLDKYTNEGLIDYISFLEANMDTAVKAVNKPVVAFSKEDPNVKKGKEGEMKTMKFLKKNNYKVYDMANEKEYQDIDTDFVIEDTEGQQFLLETKSSASPVETGKLIVELYSDITPGYDLYPGWIIKCQSDFINVHSKSRKSSLEYVYYYSTQEMKDYINEAAAYYAEAGLALPKKWTSNFIKHNNVPDTHTIGGFTNEDYKSFLKRKTKAHCLQVDINRYVASGRFLEIVDYNTGKLVYSTYR